MMNTDIVIVGSGCAALYFALKAPLNKKIILITKADYESSDSYLAQGGICMLRNEEDYQSYFNDTLKAGHEENDRESVEIMIRSSQSVIKDLIGYGVAFARNDHGALAFTREGAHSHKRILYHEDITGKEITSNLFQQVQKLKNVTLMEYTTMLDIIESSDHICRGIVIRKQDGSLDMIQADTTVLATGGIGGLYRHSTNYRQLTGDANAIALKHHIALEHINYIQVHPTTFYSEDEEMRSFLISESVRGEGAVLRDKNMNRFTNELYPRDVLTKEILKQMKKDHTKFVYEDLRTIPHDELVSHFPHIIEHCKEHGYDVTKECIPVVPAQHYFMGGIKVDHQSRTSMSGLYAIGECSCNGVHGRNRLASNSLLEALVFASRAASDMTVNEHVVISHDEDVFKNTDVSLYEDQSALEREYGRLIEEEIEREGGPSSVRMAYRDKYKGLVSSADEAAEV